MSMTQNKTTLVSESTPTAVVRAHNSDGGPASLLFRPDSRKSAWWLCEQFASMPELPQCYHGKPFTVAVALEMGGRFGLSPMASLTNISVIKGKWVMSGDMMLAVCKSCATFEDIREDFEVKDDKGHTVYTKDKRPAVGTRITIRRPGMADVSATFTSIDAEYAGLLNVAHGKQGGPWHTYRQRMCMYRARGFLLRDTFPEILAGFITTEEAHDYPEEKRSAPPRSATRVKKDGPITAREIERERITDAEIVEEDSVKVATPEEQGVESIGDITEKYRQHIAQAETHESLRDIYNIIKASPAVWADIRQSWEAKGKHLVRTIGHPPWENSAPSKTDELLSRADRMSSVDAGQ